MRKLPIKNKQAFAQGGLAKSQNQASPANQARLYGGSPKRRLQANQCGSALILTMVITVTALFIVGSISAVSILEGKMSHKARHSTPALQKADSGLEIVLGQLNGLSGNATVKEICKGTATIDSIGTWNSDNYCDLSDESSVEARVYFIDDSNQIITVSSKTFVDIKAVRSVGIEEINSDEYVTRTLQADLDTTP